MNSLQESASRQWVPSVYFASIDVKCPIDRAWNVLLDYQTWNPHFSGVAVTPVQGDPRTEGEIVLIRDLVPYVEGEPPPEFYAETVRIQAPRRVIWCVYSKIGPEFRNFVDFSLTPIPSGVRFDVGYYEQLNIPRHKLEAHRLESDSIYKTLVEAFKGYAESAAGIK